MTPRFVQHLILGFALMTSGCSLVEPRYSGTVSVTATVEGIRVSNEANYTVQVHSIAEAALPLWDTFPCYPGTVLLSGETRTFPWESLIQASPSPSRYRTMWWRDGICSTSTDDGPRGGATVTR
jgi:hypothetical protein